MQSYITDQTSREVRTRERERRRREKKGRERSAIIIGERRCWRRGEKRSRPYTTSQMILPQTPRPGQMQEFEISHLSLVNPLEEED